MDLKEIEDSEVYTQHRADVRGSLKYVTFEMIWWFFWFWVSQDHHECVWTGSPGGGSSCGQGSENKDNEEGKALTDGRSHFLVRIKQKRMSELWSSFFRCLELQPGNRSVRWTPTTQNSSSLRLKLIHGPRWVDVEPLPLALNQQVIGSEALFATASWIGSFCSFYIQYFVEDFFFFFFRWDVKVQQNKIRHHLLARSCPHCLFKSDTSVLNIG